ncbi:endonuclease [Bordetella sp. 2513F-2]
MKYAVLLSACLLAAAPALARDAFPVSSPSAIGPRTYAQAKRVLPRVYQGLEEDFYCGCPYRGKRVDLQACGYHARKQPRRAERIEWEHVVPAWTLGHQRQCWQQRIDGKPGGRSHCARTDPLYAQAEGDLVNLVPAIGEINGDRQNFRYAVWADRPPAMYGRCESVIDFPGRRMQPRKAVRGRIARIQFYMAERYGLKLARNDLRTLCVWAGAYPVDAWERARDARIRALQGSGNPYVSEPGRIAAFCRPA